MQWIGSGFLVVASALLITAFVDEPMAGQYATQLSRFGLYTLFVGSILHIGTGMRLQDD